MNHLIVNDNGEHREMTSDELDTYLEASYSANAGMQEIHSLLAAKKNAQQSAAAKLSALGLTDDEVAALIS